jgi:hypothetical protein
MAYTNMNLELLYSISTLACLLFVHDVWLARKISLMDRDSRYVVWGGLGDSVVIFRTWCLTFALSSVGICCSFYLHVFFSSGPEAIAIFAPLNLTLIAFNVAVLKENMFIVQWCLCVILTCYVALFAYTFYLFPVSSIDNTVLLYTTHACNFICILHGLFLDRIIWYMGWRQRLICDV